MMKKFLLIAICFVQIFIFSACVYYGDSRREITLAQRAEEEHYEELIEEAYSKGYSDGLDDGYESGYQDGYKDGQGTP